MTCPVYQETYQTFQKCTLQAEHVMKTKSSIFCRESRPQLYADPFNCSVCCRAWRETALINGNQGKKKRVVLYFYIKKSFKWALSFHSTYLFHIVSMFFLCYCYIFIHCNKAMSELFFSTFSYAIRRHRISHLTRENSFPML